MLLSLNWLKDYINLPKNATPEELAQKLTLHTVEVEKVENQAERFNNVIVGEILEIKKHPQADRLQIALVNIGKKKLTIVCGAPNIKVGQLVPVAQVGTILPGGAEIKEAEVRGEKSSGMLCAEDELGLGGDHSGIMVLEKAKAGQKFSDYLKLYDIIIEVDNKSLSNRPDLLSHYGIAREISAFYNLKLNNLGIDKINLEPAAQKNPGKKNKPTGNGQVPLNIKIEDVKSCLRYMAIKMDGIEVKDSPEWLQERLIAVGLRPINNIVDVTNYVMLAVGQPLHAFDAGKVENIVVRPAKKDEKIAALDNNEYKLEPKMLVITDGQKPLAIAGIIGGEDSGISASTKAIIIEAANFDATSIRKTSTKLGVRTDSSMRFEKSLDPNLAETALKLAVKLIKEIDKKAGIASPVFDENNSNLPLDLIEFDLNWFKKLAGADIPKKRCEEILTGLGFEVAEEKENILNVKIPSWRATKDISLPEDVAEEIMRLYGYDNFTGCLPEVAMTPPAIDEIHRLEWQIREILSKEAKLDEVYNYSFVGDDDLKKLNMDFSNYLELANPISKNQTRLRQNLAVGLANNVKTNQYRYENIGLFEIGTIYLDIPGELNKNAGGEERLPHQEKRVGLILAADSGDLLAQMKSIIADLFSGLIGAEAEVNFLPTELNIGYADKNAKAIINILNKNVGSIAKIDKIAGKNFGLKKKAVVADFNLKEIMNLVLAYGQKKYREVPKYPPIVRDLAFVFDQKILYNDFKKAIKNFHELIASVELFDVYSGANLGAGKKSLAFHVVYQSPDRTLTSEEIDKIQKDLINNLQAKFGAVIRDF